MAVLGGGRGGRLLQQPLHPELLHRGKHISTLLKQRIDELLVELSGLEGRGGVRVSRSGAHVAAGSQKVESIGEHADAGGDPTFAARLVRCAPQPGAGFSTAPTPSAHPLPERPTEKGFRLARR